jgi:hypothetical protein
MTNRTSPQILSTRTRAAILALAASLGVAMLPAAVPLAPSRASAVIGRPLTPVSYAGVARRSSRRVARRTVARTAAYTYPTAYPTATTLPDDCVVVDGAYTCGSTQYTPAMDGGTVVYVEAD